MSTTVYPDDKDVVKNQDFKYVNEDPNETGSVDTIAALVQEGEQY